MSITEPQLERINTHATDAHFDAMMELIADLRLLITEMEPVYVTDTVFTLEEQTRGHALLLTAQRHRDRCAVFRASSMLLADGLDGDEKEALDVLLVIVNELEEEVAELVRDWRVLFRDV